MINYSIVIPHKNCPVLLDRCVSSIPLRDDIEVIVVDDNSVNIDFKSLDCLKRRDLTLIKTTSNSGGGAARNVGVSHARGRWLIFSDSDDTFCTNELNDAMDRYVKSDADIIFFAINCLDSDSFIALQNAQSSYMDYIDMNSADFCRYKIKAPWGKMIKRELVVKNNIKFDETRVGNDAWFSLQVGWFAKEVIIDKNHIYNWLIRTNSVTSHRDKEAVMTHFNLSAKLNRFKESHSLELYRESLLVYLPMMIRSGFTLKEICSLLLENIKPKYLLFEIKAVIKAFRTK